jgi:plastocyanin
VHATVVTVRRIGRRELGLALVALAGCGGSSSSSSTAPPDAPQSAAPGSAPSALAVGAPRGRLKLAADPTGQLKFNTSALTAEAGRVTINFTNKSPLKHNVTVALESGAVLGATATFRGGTKKLTLTLAPGTYAYYCSVRGHRAVGMYGTLVVK